ncbi:MAG: hypothetical protein ACREN2_05725 [Candidatus Dormibacteria bacterium]
MTGPQKTTCKSCGEPIMWVITEAGAKMPLDVTPSDAGTVLLTAHTPPIARVVSPGRRHACQYTGQKFYVTHFSTCRHASLHRKVAARRVTPPAMPQDGLFSEASGR